jgi:prepilin-type N-terminal cleavage/methylation domain-containing protein
MLNKTKKLKGLTPLNPVKWNRQKRYLTGFTIVELMIVCAIIAILAAIIVINFERSKMRTRDAQRKSDLTRIAGALEGYKVDTKSYLSSGVAIEGTPPIKPVSSLTELTTGNYISSLPTDPLNQTPYKYASDQNQYKLLAISETITGISNASNIAGDFYNYSASNDNNFKCFQVSSSNTALGWAYPECQ